ncbi:hypothetical protein [Mycobacterium sp. 1245805.9]|uniref:hypothetical protein n=1 Tax=Mycobacterium sp. 1245805.9 TaxID=1856862 RepID=UPI0012EA9217|nr:hypothetical protein [Mycobacterium sp. 1245805.9]
MPRSARLGSQKTLHSGSGIIGTDSHFHQSLNYLRGRHATIKIRRYHMNARKPNICIYPRRRRLGAAPDATSVSIDAGVSVSRWRSHQHGRGDRQHGDGRSDHRGDIAGTALTARANYPQGAAEIAGLHGGLLPKRHVATARIVRLTLLAFELAHYREDRLAKRKFTPIQQSARLLASDHFRM